MDVFLISMAVAAVVVAVSIVQALIDRARGSGWHRASLRARLVACCIDHSMSKGVYRFGGK